MYKFIPVAKVKFSHACVAALVATILFAVLKSLFALYIELFPTYQVLYGAFAAKPLFLIWVYVAWLVILFCGEICWFLGTNKSAHEAILD
jgi:membrane protein